MQIFSNKPTFVKLKYLFTFKKKNSFLSLCIKCAVIYIFCSFVFFPFLFGTGDWTQGLIYTKHTFYIKLPTISIYVVLTWSFLMRDVLQTWSGQMTQQLFTFSNISYRAVQKYFSKNVYKKCKPIHKIHSGEFSTIHSFQILQSQESY